ncbi:hypothetical protein AAFF_G00240450 [Aldrovandia affinis]|uniref:Cadherin prodomain domain-containing protein n=1 Tax=Aldrovandia affinis TaxID=143900 RepID=A0AAD7SUI7_9TELE|nr:hypothetical protein AAFF_G00240450 [Aldrovandia affinis]
MKTGYVVLVMSAVLLGTSWGNYGDVPSKQPCKPGFSESFYTVFVSRDILQGQTLLKAEWQTEQTEQRCSVHTAHFYTAAGSECATVLLLDPA